jgi:SAM-dependent methyltransferase
VTELELIIDLHRNAERQGPGSEKETLKALEYIHLPVDQWLQVADIGCGTGGQTLTLAQEMNAQVTAIDIFPEFLEALNSRAEQRGLTHKIETMTKSMDDLPFPEEKFDIIWSEGAIYNIGFENGIKKWKEYLKTGGYLAVSEITWITNSRPKEIEAFWHAEYERIDTASNKIKILEANDYTLAGYFYLQQESWLENYYLPIEQEFDDFLVRNDHSLMAKQVVQQYKDEIALYHKFKDYYSYGFYVARKN